VSPAMQGANMTQDTLIEQLTQRLPIVALYPISNRDIAIALIQRMGRAALNLTPHELQLAMTEIQAVLEHRLDHREYINEGLDAWQILLRQRGTDDKTTQNAPD
jgi:hypothetical protein